MVWPLCVAPASSELLAVLQIRLFILSHFYLLLLRKLLRVPLHPYFLPHLQGLSNSVSQTNRVRDMKPRTLGQSGKTGGGPGW